MLALGLALAVIIGVALGFFGGGGSILMVPLLVYVLDLEPKRAIATSLLVVAAASSTGAFQHWRAGNVRVRTALLFGSAGMAGAYAGGRAAAFVDGALLMLLFAAMMLLTATAMWRGRRAASATEAAAHSPLRLVLQGGAVGLFTGLVGAGGGFLIVPALALWAGLPMPAAVGTSLLVIVLNALAGYAGYASHVEIDRALVASVATTAIAGSIAGARFARRVDPASLRKAFAGFVLAMAILILVRETPTWIGAAREALPRSGAQLVFVLLVLAAGIAAGRASRGGAVDAFAETPYEQGAGI